MNDLFYIYIITSGKVKNTFENFIAVVCQQTRLFEINESWFMQKLNKNKHDV